MYGYNYVVSIDIKVVAMIHLKKAIFTVQFSVFQLRFLKHIS